MAISDRTRKMLWGRSGNSCASCRCGLVVGATEDSSESVVGVECHIVSEAPNGPRYDSAFPREEIDSLDNLIVLCGVHHKIVDDQMETYTAAKLRQMKVEHEKWVAENLVSPQDQKPFVLKRTKENAISHLPCLVSGKQIFAILDGAFGHLFDHDELKTQEEVDLVGGFLQDARDWGEISSDLEPSGRAEAAFGLRETLKELIKAGFMVFGASEIRKLEGGKGPASDWPIAILRVLRKSNPEVVRDPRL